MSRKSFLISIVFLGTTSIYANVVPPKVVIVKDYIRGTWGEPIFIDGMEIIEKSNLRIDMDVRYYEFSRYWDKAGNGRKLEKIDYSRFTGFFGVDFGAGENVEIGARIPFLWIEGMRDLGSRIIEAENMGIGDLHLRLRVDPFGGKSKLGRIFWGAGVKLPTGEADTTKDLPTGTGSVDFSLLGYGSCDLKFLQLYFDLGYVITGKTKDPFRGEENLGDVFFYDLILARSITPSISGIVELNGYAVNPSENEEGSKTDDGQSKFTVAPLVLFSIPGVNLKVEAGFSYDLFGRNSLCGMTPLLRMKISRELRL